MAKRVLVTGGTGFIGSNMVAFLKKKGYWVRAVDINIKEREKERGELFKQADRVDCLDLRDKDLAYLATSDVDWVFHFASDMGGVGFFSKYNYTPAMDNMLMDINMLKACEFNGVKRMFYSSSACIYPIHLQMTEGATIPMKEFMRIPANSDLNYGWEKLMMLKFMEEAPFDARVGILATVYGKYQEIQGERMKFPTAIATKAIQAKKDGKPIEIWGNGKQLRQFLYIDDACEKIYRVMTMKYKEPVNIASSRVVSVDEIAKICCDIVGVEPKFKYIKSKPSGVISREVNNDLFFETYGYKEKVSIEDGFKMLIDWIKKQ